MATLRNNSTSSTTAATSTAITVITTEPFIYGDDDTGSSYMAPRDSEPAGHYWFLVLLVVPVLSVLGNLLVVAAVWRERTLKTATNFYIVSLAVADFLVAAVVMPFAVYALVNTSWDLPMFVCDLYIALDVTCSTSSIFNLVAISIDRYMAVTMPIKYSRHKSFARVALSISLVWTVSSVIGAPIVLGLNVPEDGSPRDITTCVFHNADFIIYSSLFSFFIPCLIMIYLYYQILKVIRCRAKKSRKPVTTVVANTTAVQGSNRSAVVGGGGGFSMAEGGASLTDLRPTLDDMQCDNDAVDDEEDDGKEEEESSGCAEQGGNEKIRMSSMFLKTTTTCCVIENRSVATVVTSHSQFKNSISLLHPSSAIAGVKLSAKGVTLSTPEQRDESCQPCQQLRLQSITVSSGDSGYAVNDAELGSVATPSQFQNTNCTTAKLRATTEYLTEDNNEKLKAEGTFPFPFTPRTSQSSSVISSYVAKTIESGVTNIRQRQVVSSVSGTKLPHRYRRNYSKRDRKATKTLAIVLCMFLVCWAPFFVCNITSALCMKLGSEYQPGMLVFFLTTWLGYINSLINPVIYTIFNSDFRRAFRKMLWSQKSTFPTASRTNLDENPAQSEID